MNKGLIYRFTQWSIIQWILFTMLLIVIIIPVFLHLDVQPINLWDESLFGLRAFHMYEYNSYMFNFDAFEGMQSQRNTKLPFTTFIQVLSMRLIGVNELSLRLPIVLIFMSFVIYSFHYSAKEFGSILPGAISALILVASSGFVTYHMLKTGDHDVPFAIYLSFCLLFLHRFFERDRAKDLILFTFFFLAALLTKNVMAGLIAPGVILFIAFKGDFIRYLKDFRVIGSISFIIGIYISFLLYYNFQQPWFIEKMWTNELIRRYTEGYGGHNKASYFYLDVLLNEKMMPFLYLLPFAVLTVMHKDMPGSTRNFIGMLVSAFASFMLIISFSATKTNWYEASLFPIAALIIGTSAGFIYKRYLSGLNYRQLTIIILTCFILYLSPYIHVINQNYKPNTVFDDEKIGHILKSLYRQEKPYKNFTIYDTNYAGTSVFYAQMYNEKGYDISNSRRAEFAKGENVMTCLYKDFDTIKSKYNYEVIHKERTCRLVEITGKK